jgi:hypothetical protein
MVTPDEARRLIQIRKGGTPGGADVPSVMTSPQSEPGNIFGTPADTRMTMEGTPMVPPKADILNAAPEIAGLGASLVSPPAAMGAKLAPVVGRGLASLISKMFTTGGAAGIAEGGREMVQGEPVSPMTMAQRGVENAIPSVIGEAGTMAARGGTRLLRSAIASGRMKSTGKAITGPIGNRAAGTGKGTPFTLESLNKLAATAKKYRAAISPEGHQRLIQRSNELENKILTVRDPRLQAQMKKELDELDALIPEIKAVIDKQAPGGLQTARFGAGSGIAKGMAGATLAGTGAFASGMDPQTAILISTLVGVPIGAVEASPAWRMFAGQALSRAQAAGTTLEAAIRAMLASERATDPAGGRRRPPQ